MNYNINVLVIDDFATVRRIIKETLKSAGYKSIIEAEDGKIALKILEKEEIRLIICDWIMPNMSGIELLKTVKNTDNLKNIPFIMVTAEGQKGNVIEAINAGVDNYIVKPFSPETLKDKVKKVLNKK